VENVLRARGKHKKVITMQRFTSLECNGVVDITVSAVEGGVFISSADPFLCETEGNKIIARSSLVSMGGGGITMTNGNISINGCSNNYNCFNSINGYTFIQSNKGSGTQRIIIDGVDVTTEVRQVVEKKKGTVTDEEDDSKREYTLLGAVALSEISVSGSSQCLVQDHALLDADAMELYASGISGLFLTSCKIDRLDIVASGCSKISGDVTVRRLLAKSSGTASVSKFYATESAKLKANVRASIVVGASSLASVDRDKSGCANIIVSK
jgi:hypothetical protein